MGYARAGFIVEGVDLFMDYSRGRYPYLSHKSDAIEFILRHGHKYDFIHASPPCQRHSIATSSIDRSNYPDLIAATREALVAVGKPYIIENVEGAPLRNDATLCGRMFGMTAVDDDGETVHLDRHRVFESNMAISAPSTCRPHDKTLQVAGSYGGARRNKLSARYERGGGYVPSIRVQRELLGIDWMTQRGMFQSIPPTYTEWLGRQILKQI